MPWLGLARLGSARLTAELPRPVPRQRHLQASAARPQRRCGGSPVCGPGADGRGGAGEEYEALGTEPGTGRTRSSEVLRRKTCRMKSMESMDQLWITGQLVKEL